MKKNPFKNSIRLFLVALLFMNGISFLFPAMAGQAEAIAASNYCPKQVDVVLILDVSDSMNDGGSPSVCRWERYDKTTYQFVAHTLESVSQAQCSSQCDGINPAQCRILGYTEAVPTKLNSATSSAIRFSNMLDGADDQSALVTFSDSATLKKQLSGDHGATIAQIFGLAATGATNIGEAINKGNAELAARARSGASKVIILLTDGKANKPNGNGLDENQADIDYALAAAAVSAADGYKIFTIGLGSDVNGVMLQNIASVTGGTYHAAPGGAELEAIYDQISKYICNGSISGCKYADQDNNGDYAGEAKLAGWEIELRDAAGALIQSAQTGQDGCYAFYGLSDGEYSVAEGANAAKPFFVRTYPADALSMLAIDMSDPSKQDYNVDFANYLPACGDGIRYGAEECDDGNQVSGDGCEQDCSITPLPPGSLRICKYEDLDGNFITDGDRQAVGGWAVGIADLKISTTTGENGCAVLAGLPAGEYSVAEESRTGWYSIDGSFGTQSVSLPGEGQAEAVFVNSRYGKIFGFKYEDGDKNTETNGDRSGAEGWIITLTSTSSGEMSTTTAADGFYEFADLPAGTYRLGENLLPGWIQLTADKIINLLSGGEAREDLVNAREESNDGGQPFCGDGIKNQSGEECDLSDGVPAGHYCTGACLLKQYPPAVVFPPSGGSAALTPSAATTSVLQEVLGEKLAPMLLIEKSAVKAIAAPGEKVEYRVVVSNNGNLDAYDVQVSDDFPEDFAHDNIGSEWVLGDLAPGESKSIIYNVTIKDSAQDGKYVNTARAQAVNHQEVSASAEITVVKPAVLGVKLPETGFDPYEMLALTLIIAILGVLACRVQKYNKTN